jgi:hypothetical protein
LQQNVARDVLAAFFVDHDKIDLVMHQTPDVGKRDIPAFLSVVESPIRVFFYGSGFAHVTFRW